MIASARARKGHRHPRAAGRSMFLRCKANRGSGRTASGRLLLVPGLARPPTGQAGLGAHGLALKSAVTRFAYRLVISRVE